MNQQQLQFSQTLRDRGIESVATHNQVWLERMRSVARQYSLRNGSVSADDLRRYADSYNDHPDHANAWGAVFRGAEWRVVGRVNSSIPSAHAREIKVWRWVGFESKAA